MSNTNADLKNNSNKFSKILTYALLVSVLLAVISYYFRFSLEADQYKSLKDAFFVPLKKWIYPLIAFSMFGVFFRTPDGKAVRFVTLLCDIILLYFLSTLIANIFAYNIYPVFPFAESISQIFEGSDLIEFNKKSQSGIPPVIFVMIVSFGASMLCRYAILSYFVIVSNKISKFFNYLLSASFFSKLSFIRDFRSDYKNDHSSKNKLVQSMIFINFFDKIIFGVLMMILLLSPLAVYSSFLQILHQRGFEFFLDLGKFILCYGSILLLYQFIVLPIVRSVLCFGIKGGETYGSFFKKAVPVMTTGFATASSMATVAINIKAADQLNVPEDMKNKGHCKALMPVGATFNMDGTSISLVVYFLLGAQLAGIVDISFWPVVLTAVGLSFGTAAVPSASLVMLTSMYQSFSIPAAVTGKLLSIIIAIDPIHDRLRTMVNVWGDLNMAYIVQSKRGIIAMISKKICKKKPNSDKGLIKK